MYQKFSILTYFCMKIFIFRHGLLTARLAKTTAHRVLFLVSMDSQRSKKFDGSHFWALGCLLTASGWLESIRAIMAPPPPSNVIQEPAQNRVNHQGLSEFLSWIVKIKVIIRDCQNCHYSCFKLLLGIAKIVFVFSEFLLVIVKILFGLSILSLGIVKIGIRYCQNCH